MYVLFQEELIYSDIVEVPPVPSPRPKQRPTLSAASKDQAVLCKNSHYEAPRNISNPNYQPTYIEVLPSMPEEQYTYLRNPASVLETQEAPPPGDDDILPAEGTHAVPLLVRQRTV